MQDTFIEDKLNNWGRWLMIRCDGGTGYAQSRLGSLEENSVKADFYYKIPLDEINASVTDDGIRTLDKELQQVAYYWYAQNQTIDQIRKQMKWGSTTTVQNAKRKIRVGVQAYYDTLAHMNRLKNQPNERNNFGI